VRSIHLTSSGELVEKDVPQPQLHVGEVLIRVHAAGVTPTELQWYPTSHTRDGEIRRNVVLAHEFSGEIAAANGDVGDLSIGQNIYGLNDWFEDGALAEYCVTKPASIALKPQSLTHAEAGSVPIGALTAWQAYKHVGLKSGERLLVQGAAGGVGIFAIQFARLRGAYVIATASKHNLDFVRNLGADEVLDYRAGPFEKKVSNIDVVLDAVGGDTLARSWGVLKSNGRLVTVAADSEGTADQRSKKAFLLVKPDREQLIEIGNLIDTGKVQPVVDTVVPLSRASDAYAGKLKQHVRGKIVISVVD
jgi:NADPH:quinone reductase-like Zn-dependent oxidoreductase